MPDGAVAQSGERWLCKPEVVGSIPISSTTDSGVRERARQGDIESPPLIENRIALETKRSAYGAFRDRIVQG